MIPRLFPPLPTGQYRVPDGVRYRGPDFIPGRLGLIDYFKKKVAQQHGGERVGRFNKQLMEPLGAAGQLVAAFKRLKKRWKNMGCPSDRTPWNVLEGRR